MTVRRKEITAIKSLKTDMTAKAWKKNLLINTLSAQYALPIAYSLLHTECKNRLKKESVILLREK